MKRNIIIIDDDSDDLGLIVEAISKVNPGINCVPFEDALEALNFLSNTTTDLPDLIIIDVAMPLLSGAEVLRKLREDSRYSEVPVVLHSGSVPPIKIVEEINEQRGDFRLKGFTFEAMQQQLSQILSEKIGGI